MQGWVGSRWQHPQEPACTSKQPLAARLHCLCCSVGSVQVGPVVAQSSSSSSINGRTTKQVSLVMPVYGAGGAACQASVNSVDGPQGRSMQIQVCVGGGRQRPGCACNLKGEQRHMRPPTHRCGGRTLARGAQWVDDGLWAAGEGEQGVAVNACCGLVPRLVSLLGCCCCTGEAPERRGGPSRGRPWRHRRQQHTRPERWAHHRRRVPGCALTPTAGANWRWSCLPGGTWKAAYPPSAPLARQQPV